MPTPRSLKQAALSGLLRQIRTLIAADPTLENHDLAAATACSPHDAKRFGSYARKEFGVTTHRALSFVTVDAKTYRNACKKLNVVPIEIPKTGRVPRRSVLAEFAPLAPPPTTPVPSATPPAPPAPPPAPPAATSRQRIYTDVMRFLAANPGATNDVLKKFVLKGHAMGLVAADVRKELGLRWQTQRGSTPGYRVDKSKYLKACVKHGIQPLALEDGQVVPNTTTVRAPSLLRSPAPAKRQRTKIGQRTHGPAMLRFLAQNPSATSQQAMVALGVKDFGLSSMARKELGLSWKKAKGVGGYRVDAAVYHATCKQYGIPPLPGVTEGAFFPSNFYEEVVVPETPDKPNRERARTLMSAKGTTRGTATSIATVPTSEVPPEVLAAAPRDVQPPVDTPVTTQGTDELAQLRGIIDLLRTEMAKRRIESVKVDPGGVTIRRTVVVEEPFV